MNYFGATSGGTSAGTSGGTSAGTSGGTYHGTGPGSGSAMPATLQLHVDDDTMDFEPFQPVSFDERNVHPSYWAMARLPEILAEVPTNHADFENAIVGFWNVAQQQAFIPNAEREGKVSVNQKDDLEYALSDRHEILGAYGTEIKDQSGAFHHYFYNILSLQATTHPATTRLISLAMSVAATIGMHWKLEYMRPRPVQVWPGLLPFISTPAHPSFPSNHSTQAHLTAILISRALGSDQESGIGKYLHNLALRIAVNREYAGVHFRSDTWAGIKLAEAIADKLEGTGIVGALMTECKAELSHFEEAQQPNE